jgi:hypothetical protein
MVTVEKFIEVARTGRVIQLEGMFDLPVDKVSRFSLEVSMPLKQRAWNIGLITGPSGSGKSTLVRQLWPGHIVEGYSWPTDKSIVDGFPSTVSIKEVTLALSSVGFSSPPAWLRPYHVLSNGEKFRATLARALVNAPGEMGISKGRNISLDGTVGHLTVLDEFTSLVDRTVARIGSAAVSKAVRQTLKTNRIQFVAATCHNDVLDWLQPDWHLDLLSGKFAWRSLCSRPKIQLTIRKGTRDLWRVFGRHHYLSSTLGASACYAGLVEEQPAVFTAVIHFPHAHRPGWREHRTVCLPDYQGVGLGNAMSEFIAGIYKATGKPYRSVTSHPAMIRHRAASKLWRLIRKPAIVGAVGKTSTINSGQVRGLPSAETRARIKAVLSDSRLTASFEYVGPEYVEEARGFDLLNS